MESPSFIVESGKLIIADPFCLGYTNEEVEERFFRRVTREASLPKSPFSTIQYGVLYQPFTKELLKLLGGERVQYWGQEEELHVFRHGDNFALTKESRHYADPCRDRSLDHFFSGVTERMDARKELKYTLTYPDIPLGNLLGLEGFVFNPQKLLENQASMREMRNRPPYLFDVVADACYLFIGDAEKYSRQRAEWKSRFPEITRQHGMGDLSEFDSELITESYQKVVDVKPGSFVCEYHQEWATAVIKLRTS